MITNRSPWFGRQDSHRYGFLCLRGSDGRRLRQPARLEWLRFRRLWFACLKDMCDKPLDARHFLAVMHPHALAGQPARAEVSAAVRPAGRPRQHVDEYLSL
eukprot:gnl/TRDRNA2_/TRDRNA2_171540_c0_seq2.p2 gnl/TRDRNA2_/TRDRNA2_171540_c0~~gnl/TRDRNA2_/TRDRNA2_171540_c0_seq2.p2  ORF type:complete len:101 (+),score=6.17 gnl/TRDRNA2_/TRDRNA2_171540_c0_seq2:106-408(+)